MRKKEEQLTLRNKTNGEGCYYRRRCLRIREEGSVLTLSEKGVGEKGGCAVLPHKGFAEVLKD